MFKVNDKDTQNDTNGVDCSELTKHISHLVLVFLLLSLRGKCTMGICLTHKLFDPCFFNCSHHS